MIGDRDEFAIEFEVTSEGPPLFGHVCLWLSGKKIGYFDEENMLGVVGGVLQSLVERQSSLINANFVKMRPADAFCLIKSEKLSDNGKYFVAPGESFDDFSIVCFSDEDRLHFIWELHDDPFFTYEEVEPGLHSAVIPASTFIKVVDEFIRAIRNPEK